MSQIPTVINPSMSIPAVVYVGPSIDDRVVREIMPTATIRPPIRRGDLYRDRTLRHSVFLVIDGVFYQHESLPVREIVDVLNDDAWVVGAASMGALRAAECWPAGMQGIGSIYRLFRRGVLGSDEEVAVSYNPEEPRMSSVPMINVRHAVRCAARSGALSKKFAERLTIIAASTYYADRSWPGLLRKAGVNDEGGQLEALLNSYDLKLADAIAALNQVSRRLSKSPELSCQPRRNKIPFAPAESYRERQFFSHDGLTEEEARQALVRFLLTSGRQRAVLGESMSISDLTTDNGMIGKQIWTKLADIGELDSELFRRKAIYSARQQALRIGLTLLPAHRNAAEHEIAESHGCSTWLELERQFVASPEPWHWISSFRDELAWAKCLRDGLFKAA